MRSDDEDLDVIEDSGGNGEEMVVVEMPASAMTLLPAAPGTCPKCAVKHDPAMPHNQQSLFYQVWFHREYGRWPTWRDAMAECSDEMKEIWIRELKKRGIDV